MLPTLMKAVLLFVALSATSVAAMPKVDLPTPPAKSWVLAGYKKGENCTVGVNGGSTKASGKAVQACSKTNGTIVRYSFDGSNTWKLCLFADASCKGVEEVSDNGGRVECLGLNSAAAYKVIKANTNCTATA